MFALDMPGRDRRVTQDAAVLYGGVGRTDVVTELVLPRVLGEEAVEVGIARAERRAVVGLPERPNLNGGQ
jgi:hypothetical protein